MKNIKNSLLVLALGLLTSCGSLQIQLQGNTQQPTVQTYTTEYQTFMNLDPHDLGLSHGGSWVHCRTHGFHDLNDWTDFSYSPYWCRPSEGFTRAAQWNTSWAWMHQSGWNNWNWNPRHRFNYWGNNWSPWMGNVHYGYGNNYYGWGQQNTWYWSNGYYGGNYMYGRRSNMNSRRGSLLGVYPRTTTRNGRAHAAMIESTKRTTKPRRVIREKPIVPVINNNPPRINRVIRNNRPVIVPTPKYTPSRRTVTPTRTKTTRSTRTNNSKKRQ